MALAGCGAPAASPSAPAATAVPTLVPATVTELAPTLTATSAPASTDTPLPAPPPTLTPTAVPHTNAVVLIVIDGARWTETLGDPTAEFVPHLAHDLAPLGAINTSFYNDGQTVTLPGHASMLTGVWQTIPNDGTQRPQAPTIFEYYRQATGASADQAVFVHGSTIEPALTYSSRPGYGADFGARMFFSDNPQTPYDDGMWANARQVIADLHPPLLVISLLDPDEAAHLSQWDNYRNAIKHDDEIIWDLWQQLQADPFYAGHTTLMVTNDHGRYCGDGWRDHGGTDDCNRHIMFLAVGPEIAPGQTLEQRRTLIDIAPTIGHLLGFGTPLADGQVMTELFSH